MSDDITTRLRQTRANMIGTDDEAHYWDCHDAAVEIERLRKWARPTDAERDAVETSYDAMQYAADELGLSQADCDRLFATLRGLLEMSPASGGSVANHDAVPAAIARTDADRNRTDKAALRPGKGAGNTDARLAALEELSALDQALELEYGLTGNPMIKAQEHTPQTQPTPGEGSEPREGT